MEKLKAKRNIKELIKAPSYQKDSHVRWEAAWALGEIDDPLAVEPLVDALGDENVDVRERAAWALGENPRF